MSHTKVVVHDVISKECVFYNVDVEIISHGDSRELVAEWTKTEPDELYDQMIEWLTSGVRGA